MAKTLKELIGTREPCMDSPDLEYWVPFFSTRTKYSATVHRTCTLIVYSRYTELVYDYSTLLCCTNVLTL